MSSILVNARTMLNLLKQTGQKIKVDADFTNLDMSGVVTKFLDKW